MTEWWLYHIQLTKRVQDSVKARFVNTAFFLTYRSLKAIIRIKKVMHTGAVFSEFEIKNWWQFGGSNQYNINMFESPLRTRLFFATQITSLSVGSEECSCLKGKITQCYLLQVTRHKNKWFRISFYKHRLFCITHR